MSNALAPSICCAAWLIAGAALAQPPPSPPAASGSTVVSGIVVQAKPSPATLKAFAQAVDQFVKAQGRPGPIGQISRWREPVCPSTAGLTHELNVFVSTRIHDVAERMGVPDGDCLRATNVRVVFTPDPDAFMADVRDHHPNLLGYHSFEETRFLAQFEPPMKSWYVTGTRFTAKLTGAGIDPSRHAALDAPGSVVMTWECTGTRIRCEKASDIAYVLVVVDARRIEGFTIGAIADEVAMVALSRPAARTGCSALPSVMDALYPECSPDGPILGLTAYDEAYLKGLYAYNGSGEIMAFEHSAIAEGMVKTTPVVRSAAQPSCSQSGRLGAC